MAKRGRAARNKGLTFERWTAEQFRAIGFKSARRQLEFQIQDAKGIDLQGIDPFKVQCKKYVQYVSINTINDVICDREFGDVPILVTAGDNQPAMAVMHLEDFLRLVKKGLRNT